MLKNLQFTLAVKLLFVAVTFSPSFCNITFATRSEPICFMTAKFSQVVNFNGLTTQNTHSSLDKSVNLADSSDTFSPPDRGGPGRTQGSGTRNM